MPSNTVLYFAIVNLGQGHFGAVKAKNCQLLKKLLLDMWFEPMDIESCGEIDKDGNINRTNPQKFDEKMIQVMLNLPKHKSSVGVGKGVNKIVRRIIFGKDSAVKRLRTKESLYASLLAKKHSECQK